MREKREFNFAQRWEQAQRKPSSGLLGGERRSLAWISAGVLLIGVLALTPWLWEYKLQTDLWQVNGKIAGQGEADQLWQQLKSLQQQEQNQSDLLAVTANDARDPGPLWNRLNQLLPPGAVVNSFSFQADKSVSLAVSVPNPIDVAQLWVKLRDSNLFENVDIQTVSLEDKVQTLNLNLKLK